MLSLSLKDNFPLKKFHSNVYKNAKNTEVTSVLISIYNLRQCKGNILLPEACNVNVTRLIVGSNDKIWFGKFFFLLLKMLKTLTKNIITGKSYQQLRPPLVSDHHSSATSFLNCQSTFFSDRDHFRAKS